MRSSTCCWPASRGGRPISTCRAIRTCPSPSSPPPAAPTTPASHLVHELIEARDEKRLLRLQAQLARVNLLIVDELGYVPLSQTGSELLFDVFSRRYENAATVVTSNLPFQEWTTVFASERLTGALLDRITHHVHILEMNAESYRLKQSRSRAGNRPNNPPLVPVGPQALYGRLPVARADSVLRENQVAVLYPALYEANFVKAVSRAL